MKRHLIPYRRQSLRQHPIGPPEPVSQRQEATTESRGQCGPTGSTWTDNVVRFRIRNVVEGFQERLHTGIVTGRIAGVNPANAPRTILLS